MKEDLRYLGLTDLHDLMIQSCIEFNDKDHVIGPI